MLALPIPVRVQCACVRACVLCWLVDGGASAHWARKPAEKADALLLSERADTQRARAV